MMRKDYKTLHKELFPLRFEGYIYVSPEESMPC